MTVTTPIKKLSTAGFLLPRYRQIFHAAAALGAHRLRIELHQLEHDIRHIGAHVSPSARAVVAQIG
jgi:hypothetical protein